MLFMFMSLFLPVFRSEKLGFFHLFMNETLIGMLVFLLWRCSCSEAACLEADATQVGQFPRGTLVHGGTNVAATEASVIVFILMMAENSARKCKDLPLVGS